jgi:hypothetical protein
LKAANVLGVSLPNFLFKPQELTSCKDNWNRFVPKIQSEL